MKYASDNRFVRGVYSLTTGGRKPFFLRAVAVLAVLAIYFPVRDLYIAHRTQDILRQQVEIRDKYNGTLQKQVDRYLSKEGVEDAARKDLGMVMPGEKTITVKGLDEDGNPVAKDSEDDAGSEAGASSGNDDSKSGSDSTGEAENEDSGTLKGADAADRDKSAGDTAKAADAGKEPETSAEVEAAEKSVFENSAWYWKALDALFFFDGANGMAVTSTGE